MLSRRCFLKILALSATISPLEAKEVVRQASSGPAFREAMHYRKLGDGSVGCRLCPRTCTLADNETGFCRARRNIHGTLYSLGYGSPCAVHIDPIEKKPFYNYLPNTFSFSLASAGCNLRCKFCQNWQISQISPLEAQNFSLPPENVVAMAKEKGCKSIAYTYTEPSTFYEYMLDTAKAARKEGVVNVYHSNGFINQEPLKELCKYLDAANIDLKGFSQEYYAKMCEADMQPVLETLKTLKKAGVWLEITNLVIPGWNDDPVMVRNMALWIRKNLGPETPLHFSRFFPLYKLTSLPPTPVETLDKARENAVKAGLYYVYVGNVPGHPANNTYCQKCGKTIVKRSGFTIVELNIKSGRCAFCTERIHGKWPG